MGGNSCQCYYASGPFQVTVSADGAQPVTFDLTVAPAAAPPAPIAGAALAITAGQSQSSPLQFCLNGIKTATFGPLLVTLTGSDGAALANQQVTWTPSNASGIVVQADPSGAAPCITLTNGNGSTTLDKMSGSSVTCYYAAGPFTVTASYGAASAVFNGTVTGSP